MKEAAEDNQLILNSLEDQHADQVERLQAQIGALSVQVRNYEESELSLQLQVRAKETEIQKLKNGANE